MKTYPSSLHPGGVYLFDEDGLGAMTLWIQYGDEPAQPVVREPFVDPNVWAMCRAFVEAAS